MARDGKTVTSGNGVSNPSPAALPPAGSATPPPTRRAALWAEVRYPVTRYLRVGSVLWLVSWLSIELLNRHPTYSKSPVPFRGTAFLEGWMRWDGNWYLEIATKGYEYTPGKQSSVAFFPAYPTAMRLGAKITGDPVLAGILITIVSGLVATVLLHHWVRRRRPDQPALAQLTVVTFLLWPYAYYLFGAVYADGLFICATLAAFVLLDHDRPLLAGLCGIVATAARPVGVGVLIGLVCVVLQQRGVFENRRLHLRRIRPLDPTVAFSILGLAAWCFYLQRNWGNPFLFSSIQGAPGWDQEAGPHTWFKLSWLAEVRYIPQWWHDSVWPLDVRGYQPWTRLLYVLGCTLQGAMVISMAALIPKVWKRLGWGYAIYVAAVIGIPLLGSKDWQGTGRYLLAAFPCFPILAELLAERSPRTRKVWFGVSTALLILWTSLFARGYYVA